MHRLTELEHDVVGDVHGQADRADPAQAQAVPHPLWTRCGWVGAGDKASDASVTTGVKAGLADEPLLRNSSIDVDTNDHVVTLKGTVPSAQAKARAAAIAGDTKGVTRVINQLLVRGD